MVKAEFDNFLCVYVDNSNIYHEGQRFAEKFRGEDRKRFRIHFANFMRLVSRGRMIREAVWGGSVPPPTDSLWEQLKAQGVKLDLIPRSSTGENETVDHLIQLRMHRHARKYKASPGTVVLCTGDGKGYHKDEGFLFDLEGFLEDGWRVEVVSWSHSCHKMLRRFAEEHGTFISLDESYEAVSFIKEGRRVVSVPVFDSKL